MKRSIFIMIFAAVAASAAPKLDSDREQLATHLDNSAKKFRQAVAGLSEAQWNFKAGPDRWSIAECAEHISASEDFIFGMAQKSLQAPASPERKQERMAKDAMILKRVPDRSQKFQAPEPLRPTNRYANSKGAVKHFAESRKKSLEFVRTAKADLRAHATEHPAIKEADTHQWLLFMSAHTERHTAQILEVKADPNFPK